MEAVTRAHVKDLRDSRVIARSTVRNQRMGDQRDTDLDLRNVTTY